MNLKLIGSILLTAGLALGATPAAFAEDPEYPRQGEQVDDWAEEMALSFTDVDANSDGYVNRGEAQAHAGLAANFDEADADGDGQLDAAEFDAAVALADNG